MAGFRSPLLFTFGSLFVIVTLNLAINYCHVKGYAVEDYEDDDGGEQSMGMADISSIVDDLEETNDDLNKMEEPQHDDDYRDGDSGRPAEEDGVDVPDRMSRDEEHSTDEDIPEPQQDYKQPLDEDEEMSLSRDGDTTLTMRGCECNETWTYYTNSTVLDYSRVNAAYNISDEEAEQARKTMEPRNIVLTFFGCANPDNDVYPWCVTKGECEDGGIYESSGTGDKLTWDYCAIFPNTDTGSQVDAEVNEEGKVRLLQEHGSKEEDVTLAGCPCLETWTFHEVEYTGCANPDSDLSSWCPTVGACAEANGEIDIDGEIKMWGFCQAYDEKRYQEIVELYRSANDHEGLPLKSNVQKS
eukprot:Filipodium_phascolosomae@DN6721_c0_g1_i1.p1